MDASPTDTIADGVQRPLDPRWVEVQRIRAVVGAVVIASGSFTGMVIVSAATRATFLMLLPLWVVLVALVGWQLYRWPPIAHRFASYRVDAQGLEIASGVYWRTTANVPRSRVQHTDVSQGPLERRYGLGTLIVYTAGTQHSQVKLRGLDVAVARRIRAHLLPDSEGDAV